MLFVKSLRSKKNLTEPCKAAKIFRQGLSMSHNTLILSKERVPIKVDALFFVSCRMHVTIFARKRYSKTMLFFQKGTCMKKMLFLFVSALLIGLSGCIGKKEIDKDLLVVGTETNFPPFSSKLGDEIVGFDIDMVKEVAHRLGKRIELQDMSFEALIPQAELGSVHIIAAGMTPTENRAEKVFFTRPYISGDPLLIVGLVDRLDVGSLEALKQGKRVVVNQGYTSDLFMSNVEGPELIRLETPAEAFLALEQGRADAFVTARNSLAPFFALHDEKNYVITPIAETTEQTAMIVSKKYPALLEQVQQVIDEMEADGTVDALKVKWGMHV